MGLLDFQRRCGYPGIFRTRAPYEKPFLYHQWVLDKMAKAGRGRQMLACPETLHQAHALKEFDRGYFTGINAQKRGRPTLSWQNHVLASENEEVRNTVGNYFSRLEFKDGKRKRDTQRYHGRGTAHSHILDHSENHGAIKLEENIAAAVPSGDNKLLRGLVLNS